MSNAKIIPLSREWAIVSNHDFNMLKKWSSPSIEDLHRDGGHEAITGYYLYHNVCKSAVKYLNIRGLVSHSTKPTSNFSRLQRCVHEVPSLVNTLFECWRLKGLVKV